MYKKQMTFQRIVCVLMLFACALVFVYSLGLMTDLYDCLFGTIRTVEKDENNVITNVISRINGSELYIYMQQFNRDFTFYSIVVLVLNLLLFIMGTNTRRRYYIGNYVSIAVSVIANVALTVWAIPQIMAYKTDFLKIDFAALEQYNTRVSAYYTESTFFFDICYLVFGVLLCVTVLLVINMILKIIVMKAEKNAIGSRKDVRA